MRQGEEEFNLLERVRFDLDFDVWMKGFEVLDSVLEEMDFSGGDVVVFHHDHVVEADSVIGSSAGEDGFFFEESKSGSGFPCVENTGFCVGNGFDVVAC